ncbi:MAG: tRNA 2-thiouridine(34) synthase MnmA [Patescibacteria group bacterium]
MKIALLLSGGVDSSVALRLLKEAGHDVTAFYIKIWLEDELAYLGNCPWEEDLKYAREVTEQAGVPLEVISLQKEYWDTVVAYTIRELKAGRTPNPDMLCNQQVKFGLFFEKAGKGFDKIASGHYAEVEESGTSSSGGKIFHLKRSPDPVKDQTYFLAYLTQLQLSRIIFPIGMYAKSEIREMAKKFDLPSKDRKDSQGICFLGSIKFSDFVKHHLGTKTGDIIEISSGKKLGEHEGFWYYTIGQRHGIKLSGGPWFVVKKDIEKNIVYVGGEGVIPSRKLFKFSVESVNWNAVELTESRELGVRIRHGGAIYPATIEPEQDGNTVRVRLKEPRYDLAPGQFAVFYDGDYCLGGGVISLMA